MSPLPQLLQADCIDALAGIPAGSVDLVVTDPPYVTHYRDRNGRSVARGRLQRPAVGPHDGTSLPSAAGRTPNPAAPRGETFGASRLLPALPGASLANLDLCGDLALRQVKGDPHRHECREHHIALAHRHPKGIAIHPVGWTTTPADHHLPDHALSPCMIDQFQAILRHPLPQRNTRHCE